MHVRITTRNTPYDSLDFSEKTRLLDSYTDAVRLSFRDGQNRGESTAFHAVQHNLFFRNPTRIPDIGFTGVPCLPVRHGDGPLTDLETRFSDLVRVLQDTAGVDDREEIRRAALRRCFSVLSGSIWLLQGTSGDQAGALRLLALSNAVDRLRDDDKNPTGGTRWVRTPDVILRGLMDVPRNNLLTAETVVGLAGVFIDGMRQGGQVWREAIGDISPSERADRHPHLHRMLLQDGAAVTEECLVQCVERDAFWFLAGGLDQTLDDIPDEILLNVAKRSERARLHPRVNTLWARWVLTEVAGDGKGSAGRLL